MYFRAKPKITNKIINKQSTQENIVSLKPTQIPTQTPTQTQVVGEGDAQVVKTVAWYDNEAGFTAQMIRTLEKFASML